MEIPKKRKKKRFNVLEDRILSYERPLPEQSSLKSESPKYDISFFPKPGGERSELYKDRWIKLHDFLSGQQSLNFE